MFYVKQNLSLAENLTQVWQDVLPNKEQEGKSPVTRRGLLFLGIVVCANLFLAGCRKSSEPLSDLMVECEISPQPPKVGPATVTLRLADAGGNPLSGAQVKLEGNMSHAGMRPVFAEAKEVGPGRYQAPLEFTMGGDWIILIHLTLADGRVGQRQVEVKGVRPD